MAELDPLVVGWTAEQTAALEGLHDWAVGFTELNQHLAAWMGLPGSDAAALGHILRAAEEGAPISPADLSRRIGMTSGATTVLLNRLETAGHISRSREHADRRRVTLRPEPAARQRAQEFFAAAGTEIAEVVLSAPAEQLRQVTEFVARITEAAVRANARLSGRTVDPTAASRG